MSDENTFVHPNVKSKSSETAMKKSSAKGMQKSIEETYTKKTQLEHILLRPDTYIGSVDKQMQQMWVYDKESNEIKLKNINFVPGLYKIFDEIIVNAADNKQRDLTMSRLEVDIDEANGSIRVWNNGSGIPIALHKEHQIYVPELIFGQLLTGSNFDDNEAKTTGGRNGYGAKLANIFSSKFVIETADRSRNLKYKQVFTNNMSTRAEPEISKFSGEDYTCVTFFPDLARFKMDSLDEDIVALMSKRVYDIAGTTINSGSSKFLVILNKKKLDVKNFETYISMYDGLEEAVAFEKVNERWEIGVAVSEGTFQQVSFVNSISTMKGGCHVNYIADQITAKLMPVVKRKNKGEEVKANQIKNHLTVFVNALIVNPAFSSQTKEVLTTIPVSFGSTCVVSEKFMKQVEKSGIIENILNWAKYKQTAELKKKGGSKRSKLVGIPKLDDANSAGTAKSLQCTLILTEGDSAKALAVSGLGVVGRDFYGVFPLKGKLLNVREASHQQIMKNEEIQNISKILGLTFGKVYTDLKDLRYGHLMIMTDQDHDGSHIKGLLINFLHHFWPSLLQINGFLQQFITPIVKCFRGKKELSFYTIPEYQTWKEANNDGNGWDMKYYKGLGTSTSAEAKEYFSNLQTHEIDFRWDDRANDMIDMAFAKKRVEDRKLWLLKMEAGVHIDYKVDEITYDNFINHELILFSHADNERSIPNFMDGLKPSQRKVLFCCFKRNLRKEIKVAQLSGYIAEHSAYHHGDASLTQTIIGMAQNFVGSNNINLLSPCGQFGTRLMGGKDAASARYVFTKLESITRCIYHPHDDRLLEYLEDDGLSIEPLYYAPIIPMALVNGSEGIGTGWSTSVPTYDPRQIINNLRKLIVGEEPEKMTPWFRGFNGEITEKVGTNNFTVSGILEQIDETTVVISELPVGKWTTDYKQFLESVLIGNGGNNKDKDDNAAPVTPFIKDFKENHTDTTVLFTVTIPAEKMAEIVNDGKGGLIKKFKLDGSVSTTNMHMFDVNSHIRKFDSPLTVLKEFYKIRIELYDRRKQFLINKLSEEWAILDNKMRFILEVIKGTLVVSNRKKVEILAELKSKGYKTVVVTESEPQPQQGEDDSGSVNSSQNSVDDKPVTAEAGYDYLLSMKIWSLTMERVQDLLNQRDSKRAEWDKLLLTTAESLWLEDLTNLEVALDRYEDRIEAGKKQELAAKKKARNDKAAKSKGGSSKAKSRGRKGGDSDDDDDDGDAEQSDFEGDSKKRKKKPTVAISKPPSSSSTALAKLTSAKPVPVTVAAATASITSSTNNVLMPSSSVETTSSKAKATDGTKPVKEKKPRAPSAKSLTKAAASAAAVTSKPITNFFKKKSKSNSDDEDDDIFDEDEIEVVEMPKINRVPRAAAVVAKSKAAATIHRLVDSDEEEFDDGAESDDDEEDDGFVEEPSFDFIASDSDSDAEVASGYKDIKAIKSKAKKATKPSKKEGPVKATQAVAIEKKQKKTTSTTASSSSVAATNNKKKGVKRVAKSSDVDENVDDDSMHSEEENPASKKAPLKKKLKAQSAFESAPGGKKPKAVKSAEPMKSAKVQSKKKVVTSDQDDESLVDLTGSEPVVVVHRPGRQTKQQALKKMVMVDSESEEDADESDFGDDESD